MEEGFKFPDLIELYSYRADRVYTMHEIVRTNVYHYMLYIYSWLSEQTDGWMDHRLVRADGLGHTKNM